MSPVRGYAGTERPRDEDLALCTRCGMCEQACPTYRILHVEPDSPRGRVFLMKQVADGAAEVNDHLAEHLYACLGCRACETVCPSGVPYGRLLEYARFQIEERGDLAARRRGWRVFRFLFFRVALPSRLLFWLALFPARLLQRLPGLAKALLRVPLPSRVRRLVMMIPPRPNPVARTEPVARGRSPLSVARGRSPLIDASEARGVRVGFFTGCVMDSLFRHVNDATIRVLARHGCQVVVPRGQWCCGALNVHAGERSSTKKMARRNIDAFEKSAMEAIVVNSAGCGAVLKEYGELLRDDPLYASRAAAFAGKVRDFSEFLHSIAAADGAAAKSAGAARVTYQDACHLAHGQRIREQPRALIRGLPGIDFVELSFADRCCGAAGVYNLTHPELSEQILAEKLDAVERTGCETVIVTNPGCHMQLLAGAASRNKRLRVLHLAELLDDPARAASS